MHCNLQILKETHIHTHSQCCFGHLPSHPFPIIPLTQLLQCPPYPVHPSSVPLPFQPSATLLQPHITLSDMYPLPPSLPQAQPPSPPPSPPDSMASSLDIPGKPQHPPSNTINRHQLLCCDPCYICTEPSANTLKDPLDADTATHSNRTCKEAEAPVNPDLLC